MILQVQSINTYYGTSHILHQVSLQVDSGKVVALLGRNGVGKNHYPALHYGIDAA